MKLKLPNDFEWLPSDGKELQFRQVGGSVVSVIPVAKYAIQAEVDALIMRRREGIRAGVCWQ